MTRLRTIVAVCLIVTGVITMTGPTFGFSSLAADRGVQAATADDPSAYLGIVDNSGSADADIENNNGESLLYYLNDNAGTFSTASAISANATSFNGEPTRLDARVEADSGSNDYVVIVTCGSSDRKGTGTVTIEITAGENIHIELNRTTTNEVNIKCRGGNDNSGGPTADAGGPYTVVEGTSIELDGTASSGKVRTHTWQITSGNGTLSEPSTATPVYSAPSDVRESTDIVVELEVRDNKGTTDIDTTTVTVKEADSTTNYPPIADFSYSRKGNSENVDLDGSSSYDPDGTIDSYQWDIGNDGTIDDSSATVTRKLSSGTEVVLIVTDNNGETSSITRTIN